MFDTEEFYSLEDAVNALLTIPEHCVIIFPSGALEALPLSFLSSALRDYYDHVHFSTQEDRMSERIGPIEAKDKETVYGSL